MKHQIMTVMLDAFLIINALPPYVSAKTLAPTFSMVHLLHRLYGVDAPDPDPHILRRIYATVLAYKKCVGANYGGGSKNAPPSRENPTGSWAT